MSENEPLSSQDQLENNRLLNERYFKEGQLSHERDQLELRRGCVGMLIGAGDESKINVAFLVIVTCSFFLLISFSANNPEITDWQKTILVRIWETFPPIITLALGYIFGRNASSKGGQ